MAVLGLSIEVGLRRDMDAKAQTKKGGLSGEASQLVKRKDLGKLAVEAGLITDKQLALAVKHQADTGRSLPDLLQELYGLDAETVRYLLARDAGIEAVDLTQLDIDEGALKKIPADFAAQHKLFPISLSQNRLTVAMANPFELATLDQLQFMTRLYVDARYAPAARIVEAIEKYYGGGAAASPAREKREGKESYASVEEGEETVGPQVIRLVDTLISRAIGEEATDIHIEPEEEGVKVRFRIDGILHIRPAIPKTLQPAVITRLKILAGMDISENRLPQDGRMSFTSEGKDYDLRVSTFPTIYGEKTVLRILDKERLILGLEQLGLSSAALSIFEESVNRPHGIILVTGPTGSGKTTTLYSTLAVVNSAEKNIMTLEDPVEYEIPNILQSQINPKAGLTFATGLRALLRQDPDVILVGEMRDAETADVAIRAALTGHLVFSTLHTNDAVGAIPRLLDMGVDASLMASTFVAIVAQRLVRKICAHCKEPAMPHDSVLKLVGLDREKKEGNFYRGKGCGRCFETGFRGRIGVFEVLTCSPAIAQMITHRSPAHAILRKAKEEGMTTMMEDGLEKARRGMTALDEVVRVAYQISDDTAGGLVQVSRSLMK